MKEIRLDDHTSGDTWPPVQFKVESSPGIPLSLTGAAIHLQVRDRPNGCLVDDCSLANGKVILSDAAGGLFQTSPHVVTAPGADYFWEVEVTLQDGTVFSIPGNDDEGRKQEGRWKIFNDISRPAA